MKILNLVFLQNVRGFKKVSLAYTDILPASKSEVWTRHYLVPCCEMTKATDKTKKLPSDIRPPSVAIIGAGMAGISAAERLIKAGITDIKILEAKKSAGGRIRCTKLGKSLIEFGADSIEGSCVANPIYNLAALKCLLVRRECCRKRFYLTTAGETYLENTAAKNLIKKILNEASGYFSRPKCRIDISLEEFLSLKIEEYMRDVPHSERYSMEVVISGLLNKVRGRVGEDLQFVSLNNYGSYIEIPGGKAGIPRGTLGLVSALMKDIPKEKIKYGRTVQNVRFTPFSIDSPRAAIKCCDGEEFLADYVICTVSLGVLKAGAGYMFLPNLPEEKLEAIRSIGFGHVTKIFLEYEKPFWAKNEKVDFLLAWSLSDKMNHDDWIKGITSIEALPVKQNILKVTVAGKEAIWVEQAGRNLVGEEMTNFLRKVSGDRSLPCPKEILMSSWSSDLNFLGARSYLGLGSSVLHQCILASPVPGVGEEGPPILLFAGEATSPGHFGTLHGARISGIREAERIIDLTIELQGPPKHIDFEQPQTFKSCIADNEKVCKDCTKKTHPKLCSKK